MGVKAVPRTELDKALTDLVEALYDRYYESLFAYVYRLVDDPERAQELVQESFLRLYRERAKLREVENRRAWIYRIVTNVTFKAMRRRSLRLRFSHQTSVENLLPAAEPGAGISDEVLNIERALATLPVHYRAPLLLHSYFGFTVRETAIALEITETAVTTRIYRAKKMFREAYEPT